MASSQEASQIHPTSQNAVSLSQSNAPSTPVSSIQPDTSPSASSGQPSSTLGQTRISDPTNSSISPSNINILPSDSSLAPLLLSSSAPSLDSLTALSGQAPQPSLSVGQSTAPEPALSSLSPSILVPSRSSLTLALSLSLAPSSALSLDSLTVLSGQAPQPSLSVGQSTAPEPALSSLSPSILVPSRSSLTLALSLSLSPSSAPSLDTLTVISGQSPQQSLPLGQTTVLGSLVSPISPSISVPSGPSLAPSLAPSLNSLPTSSSQLPLPALQTTSSDSSQRGSPSVGASTSGSIAPVLPPGITPFPAGVTPPPSSIDVDLVASTMVSPPPDFSTEALSGTISGNQWLTTTDKGGHSTIVPVVGGIILFNLPELLHVSFQFPGFPKLPHFHLPCIKVFGIRISGDCDSKPKGSEGGSDDNSENPKNDNDDDKDKKSSDADSATSGSASSTSESSSGSTSSCTKSQVVSDCSVLCTATASTQTCSTTCSTTTGYSVTSTIATSSASTDACVTPGSAGSLARRTAAASDGCGGCPPPPPDPTEGPLAVVNPPNDDVDVEIRAIAGRFLLEKRGDKPKTQSKVTNCVLATPPGLPVTTPVYTDGGQFWSLDIGGNLPATLSPLSRYYRTASVAVAGGCIPTITKVNAADWTPAAGRANVPTNDKNTVDHAYENNWLISFLEKLIESTQLTCNDMNAMFFATNPCNVNRMEPIFGALANPNDPDFVVMSEYVNNNAKGWLLNARSNPIKTDLDPAIAVIKPNVKWSIARSYLEAQFNRLERVIVASSMLKTVNTIDLMVKTNKRMYQKFRDLDDDLAQVQNIPNPNFGFALRYQSFMEDLMNGNAGWNKVPSQIQTILDNLSTSIQESYKLKGADATELDQFKALCDSYKAKFDSTTGSARNEINFVINWDWGTNIPRSLHKREDTCARPSQASSSPSPTTALPTSTTASLKTPTGEAAAASCYPHVDTGDNSGQTKGNKPPGDPSPFHDAIDKFCGDNCQGDKDCKSATGFVLKKDQAMFLQTFDYEDGKSNGRPRKFNMNLGFKLVDQTCSWRVSYVSCLEAFTNILDGCRTDEAGGVSWNECLAWTIGAGPVVLGPQEFLDQEIGP